MAEQVTGFIQELRQTELYKIPGVSETLDWTAALLALNQTELDPEVIDDTLGIILKYQDDIEKIKGSEAANLSPAPRPRRARLEFLSNAIVAKLSDPHGGPLYAGGSKKRTGQRRLTAVR